MAARGQGDRVWELARAGAGFGFLAAAAFNALVTVRRPAVFLDQAQRNVWLAPWGCFLTRIMVRRPQPVLVAVIAYEASVGLLILGRGRSVRAGVGGAMIWAGVTTPVLPAGQAVGNAALVPALAPMLTRSFDQSTWALLRQGLST